MKTPDILTALTPVTEAFEQLSIPYYIGGSVASSLYGMARSTMDVDIVADIKKNYVSKLRDKLDEKYYIDEDMIIGAIENSSSFNLIHLETAIKIDVFIYKDEPHQRKAIERKVKDKFDEELDYECYFSSPEDIIIAKFQWFELGNRTSQLQWLDILGGFPAETGGKPSSVLRGVTSNEAAVIHLGPELPQGSSDDLEK